MPNIVKLSPPHRRFSFRGAAAGCVLLLAACGVEPDGLAPIPEADTAIYHLGPGDQVRVITAGEEQLSGQFRVDADGTVDIPTLGPVPAANLTSAQLSGAIAAQLHARRHYRDPSVSVEVAGYRTVAVIGEVNRPGQYPYQPGMTVLLAVASAGGFTYRAIDDRFTVSRTIDGHVLKGKAGPQTKLLPGDVIGVVERQI